TGQPGQGRCRTGGAEHEPHVRVRRDRRPGAGGGPALTRYRGMGMRPAVLRGLVWALALLLALVARGLARHFGRQAGEQQRALALQEQADAWRTAAAEANARLAKLQGQFDVERATRHGLEETLARQQRALGQTRDQLAFYEQLIPPGPAGTVSVRA